jgi:hypothetical protein
MNKRRYSVVLGLIVLAYIVVGPVGGPVVGLTEPRISTYPHTHHLQTEVGRLPNWPGARHTTFQTADTPDQVLAWYRKRMRWWHGWTKVDERSPSRLRFPSEDGSPSYFLDVTTWRAADGTTNVELWYAWVGS